MILQLVGDDSNCSSLLSPLGCLRTNDYDLEIRIPTTMSFLYSLPTTASVRLTELVSDPTGAHTSDLARVSAARGRVRAVLKEARRAQAGNKDWQGCAIVRLPVLRGASRMY